MLSTPSGLTVLSGYRALSLKTDRSVLILKDTSQRDTPLGHLAVLTGKGAEMSGEDNEIVMKIEEAILYALAERNGGLRTEQIADIINRRKLHLHKDGLVLPANK